MAKKKVGTGEQGRELRVVHAVSDSTGNLVRHMLHALVTQFPPDALVIRVHAFASTGPKLEDAMQRVAAEPGVVFHALVGDAGKRKVERACAKLGLPCADLTGPFAHLIAGASGLKLRPDVGRLHQVDEQYRRRITAMDFTLEHDDGLGLRTLHEADVVLTGVSRTSKTPTSIVLAQDGLKVANVSLAQEVAPPAELVEMVRQRVVGLYIDPTVLTQIRARRWRAAGGERGAAGGWRSSYADAETVEREVEWSRHLFRSHGWRTLDVTDQAIEETAGRVREVLAEAEAGEGE
ncbi:MAG: pyruvate, water dikinase regulatory protein [Phycisphaeraceae bacterium]